MMFWSEVHKHLVVLWPALLVGPCSARSLPIQCATGTGYFYESMPFGSVRYRQKPKKKDEEICVLRRVFESR